jgi:hypothetical protein
VSDITKRLADISEMMMEGQPFNDGDFTDIDAAIDEIERLREQLRLANIDATNNEAEANELRAERDEARREVARLLDVETGHRIAIASLTAERDEARRMACDALAAGDNEEASEYARLRGWCYLRWPDPDALDRLAKLDEEVGF